MDHRRRYEPRRLYGPQEALIHGVLVLLMILALISVVCVAVLAAIGGKANGILRSIANNL